MKLTYNTNGVEITIEVIDKIYADGFYDGSMNPTVE
jgi:hypothetical protein